MAATWYVKIGKQHDSKGDSVGPATFSWIDDVDGVLFSYSFLSMHQTAVGASEVKTKLEALRDAHLAPEVENVMTKEMNK